VSSAATSDRETVSAEHVGSLASANVPRSDNNERLTISGKSTRRTLPPWPESCTFSRRYRF
jgi:hypothetical protein